jgi:beta-glucosidase
MGVDSGGAIEFPRGFVWGAATAAYQIEGAAHEDGRGLSIWDTFSHTPGNVRNGDTGDMAADHYHRYREDVALMADLGLKAYRFSVSWPRVQPSGSGATNQPGLDFYQRLVDELLEHDIAPWVTLYHWDLPQALQVRGGWANRETAYRFADFATRVYAALSDRVEHWLTINEPWCAAFLGYATGVHAPGISDHWATVRAAHHLLLGHGLAVRAMRAVRADRQIGVTLNFLPVRPATDSPDDVDACRRVDGLQNRMFLDPVTGHGYPADVLDDLRAVIGLQHLEQGDDELIGAPIDLLGVNYYTAQTVHADPTAAPSPSPWVGAPQVAFRPSGADVTAMGWEITPDGLTDLLCRLGTEHPGLPLVVTENGMANHDYVSPYGEVRDPERVAYLDAHLRAAHAALEKGVDLRGYFVWSLLDNFEWAEGYAKRFGMVHVDYQTQRRIVKESGGWYAAVIARNGLEGAGT